MPHWLSPSFPYPPHQSLLPVDPVDLRDREDYGMDPGTPDSLTHAHNITIEVAAALFEGFAGFNAEEFGHSIERPSVAVIRSKGWISEHISGVGMSPHRIGKEIGKFLPKN